MTDTEVVTLDEHASLVEKLEFLQDEAKQLPQVEVTLRHYFAHGIYGRELARPAGTLIIGKIHKTRHMFILLSGEMSVLTDNGMERFVAPQIVIGSPGTKRLTYAHTDCVAIVLHGTPLTDLDEIEKVFVAQNDQEYLKYLEDEKLLIGEKS